VRARARERARTRQTERESERGRAGPSTTSLIRRTARCAPCGGREEEKESRREGESARARARGSEAERQRERSRAAEREAGPLVDSNSRHPAGDWEDSELGMERGAGRETERWETERKGGGSLQTKDPRGWNSIRKRRILGAGAVPLGPQRLQRHSALQTRRGCRSSRRGACCCREQSIEVRILPKTASRRDAASHSARAALCAATPLGGVDGGRGILDRQEEKRRT
jgi:hypothetical protein